MDLIGLSAGDGTWIYLDSNKAGQYDITVNDGPIESALRKPLGRVLDATTLLYGKVWTSGPDVVIRYYEARPPQRGSSGVIPICGVARLGGGQLKKKPGPAPGSAILEFSEATIMIVDAFR